MLKLAPLELSVCVPLAASKVTVPVPGTKDAVPLTDQLPETSNEPVGTVRVPVLLRLTLEAETLPVLPVKAPPVMVSPPLKESETLEAW